MKKLYRQGKVHPSLQPAIADHLALLPATILSLAAALTPEDKEVLAYLMFSCANTSASHRKNTQKSGGRRRVRVGGDGGGEHPPSFNCDCFRCYMSFWARWDSSPNRQLIHEIIEAYEDGLFQNKNLKMKKERRRRVCNISNDAKQFGERLERPGLGESDSVEVSCSDDAKLMRDDSDDDGAHDDDGEEACERGSVRKLVSFIGERFWGVWGK